MVFDSVKKIIAEELNIDESSITLETRLVEDLKADSIDSIQLIMALEEEFNISISDDSVQDIKTVGDIVNIIKKK
ncbi:MAG: acyl carrier protein [Bacilli bacterium]|jgi:acyl carrier protein